MSDSPIQMLRRALTQRSLVGEVWYAKDSKYGYGQRRKRDRSWGPPILIPVEPILDREIWDALQERLEATAVGPREQAPHFYELTGRLHGSCGERFGGVFRKDRRKGVRQYRCKGKRPDRSAPRCEDAHRMDAAGVEEAVWQAVCSVLTRPHQLIEMHSEWLEARGKEVGVEKSELEAVAAKIASKEQALAILIGSAAEDGSLRSRVTQMAISEKEAELDSLVEYQAELQRRTERGRATDEHRRDLLRLASITPVQLAKFTPKERAAVYESIELEVRVTGYEPETGRPDLQLEGTVFPGLADHLGGDRRPEIVGPQGLEPCPPD